jgi:hypothetical protein
MAKLTKLLSVKSKIPSLKPARQSHLQSASYRVQTEKQDRSAQQQFDSEAKIFAARNKSIKTSHSDQLDLHFTCSLA